MTRHLNPPWWAHLCAASSSCCTIRDIGAASLQRQGPCAMCKPPSGISERFLVIPEPMPRAVSESVWGVGWEGVSRWAGGVRPHVCVGDAHDHDRDGGSAVVSIVR
eukprot:scaffold30710_cov109-Isochrysis_galbana.AAC.1